MIAVVNRWPVWFHVDNFELGFGHRFRESVGVVPIEHRRPLGCHRVE